MRQPQQPPNNHLSFYGSRSSLFSFLRPAFSLDVAFDPQCSKKYILFIFPKFCYKIDLAQLRTYTKNLWSLEYESMKHRWRLPEDEETNGHERSTWRLRTPTICRRSVPALCNAGLPKKKTLQQGKIDRKTKQIVLVSMMPQLECPLLLLTERLPITCQVFTWMPLRGTHIKVC